MVSDWECSSVAGCLPGMCKVPSASKTNNVGEHSGSRLQPQLLERPIRRFVGSCSKTSPSNSLRPSSQNEK